MRLVGLYSLSFLLAVMSSASLLPAGGQAPTPPPTSAISCIPPVPGPDWICQDGGWLPLGHPLIRPSGEAPPPPTPPTGGTGTPEGCIPPVPGPDWVCQDAQWYPLGHPELRASAPSMTPAPPAPPPLPTITGTPGRCLIPDPFAGARGGFFGLFGVCVNGDWYPIGHPLATDYLGRPLATDYSGIYTLTLIADDCTAEVPDVLKHRVYTARIEQNGATVQVFLSGADFLPGSNFAGIVVSPDEIRFEIFSGNDYYDGSFFGVAEKIAGVGTLVVSGGLFNATTSITGTRMNSASSGNQGIIFLDTGFVFSHIDWVCSISRFDLTRQ